MGLIENVCGVTCNYGGVQEAVCSKPQGHAGAHFDLRLAASWNDREPPAHESIEKATREQIEALQARENDAKEFARARDEEARAYDQEQGRIARAHGWALQDAQAWAMFAAAADAGITRTPEQVCASADLLFAEYRKRFEERR